MTRPAGLAVAALAALALSAAGCAASTTSGRPAQPATSSPASAPSVTSTPTAVTPAIPATPAARPNGCAANTTPQLVRVSVAGQHLWMCSGPHVVRETPVTTGIVGQYTETPTGSYVVQDKVRNTTLTLNTGATYRVNYWIPFDGPLFGFHDSSWQDFPYGSVRYRTEGSHGCVHVPLSAIRFLYGWARVGATVRIEP